LSPSWGSGCSRLTSTKGHPIDDCSGTHVTPAIAPSALVGALVGEFAAGCPGQRNTRSLATPSTPSQCFEHDTDPQ